MSDAITQCGRNSRVIREARHVTCMYFGKTPMENGYSKQSIEEWLSSLGKEPETVKAELERVDLFWWHPCVL